MVLCKGSRKKVFFIVVGPLRGGGVKAGTLRKITFFDASLIRTEIKLFRCLQSQLFQNNDFTDINHMQWPNPNHSKSIWMHNMYVHKVLSISFKWVYHENWTTRLVQFSIWIFLESFYKHHKYNKYLQTKTDRHQGFRAYYSISCKLLPVSFLWRDKLWLRL